jgi:hypothetical protein
MSQDFKPGDFLVFQLESGFGLLRVLAVDNTFENTVWHLAAYADLFPDVDSAEAAANSVDNLTVTLPHAALTDRAFESTQVARIGTAPLNATELVALTEWTSAPDREVADRSIRLLLGLR